MIGFSTVLYLQNAYLNSMSQGKYEMNLKSIETIRFGLNDDMTRLFVQIMVIQANIMIYNANAMSTQKHAEVLICFLDHHHCDVTNLFNNKRFELANSIFFCLATSPKKSETFKVKHPPKITILYLQWSQHSCWIQQAFPSKKLPQNEAFYNFVWWNAKKLYLTYIVFRGAFHQNWRKFYVSTASTH